MFNAFLSFNPSVYALSIDIWTTSDQARVFSNLQAKLFKKFRSKIGIFVFSRDFFKISWGVRKVLKKKQHNIGYMDTCLYRVKSTVYQIKPNLVCISLLLISYQK